MESSSSSGTGGDAMCSIYSPRRLRAIPSSPESLKLHPHFGDKLLEIRVEIRFAVQSRATRTGRPWVLYMRGGPNISHLTDEAPQPIPTEAS